MACALIVHNNLCLLKCQQCHSCKWFSHGGKTLLVEEESSLETQHCVHQENCVFELTVIKLAKIRHIARKFSVVDIVTQGKLQTKSTYYDGSKLGGHSVCT